MGEAMDPVTILGLTAGGLTTASFLPQVVKTWKTKSAEDISSGMFLMFSTGVLLWLIYGFATAATPIIVANAVTLVLAVSILVLKFRYSGRK